MFWETRLCQTVKLYALIWRLFSGKWKWQHFTCYSGSQLYHLRFYSFGMATDCKSPLAIYLMTGRFFGWLLLVFACHFVSFFNWNFIPHLGFHSPVGISFVSRDFIRHLGFHSSLGISFVTWNFIRHLGFHSSLGISFITWDFIHHLGFHSSLGISFVTRDFIRH